MDQQANIEHIRLRIEPNQEEAHITTVNEADNAINAPTEISKMQNDKVESLENMSNMETDDAFPQQNLPENVNIIQQELPREFESPHPSNFQNQNKETETSEKNLNFAKETLLNEINLSENLEPKTENSTHKQFKAKKLAEINMGKNNFFKGCKWAPDGLCLMTNSDDNVIRLINTPHDVLAKKWDTSNDETPTMDVCLKIKEAETIYDYAWWPQMNSMYPATCCLATTSMDQPIHLWDAFNGELRASYIAKNNVDEVHAAHSLTFSPDGMQLICGFAKEIRLFYIDRPGSICEKWPTRKSKHTSGQRGIISTLEFSPDASTFACGSYDGTAAIYSSKNGEVISIFNAKTGGVTHIKYSPDGERLYIGSRKNNSIICWDIRQMGGDLFHLDRVVDTNQRIYFDLASTLTPSRDMDTENVIVSGGTDGPVSIWDVNHAVIEQNTTPVLHFEAHRDCTNGVNIHPFLPVLATASGQRVFSDISDSENDSDVECENFEENSLKLWHINCFDY